MHPTIVRARTEKGSEVPEAAEVAGVAPDAMAITAHTSSCAVYADSGIEPMARRGSATHAAPCGRQQARADHGEREPTRSDDLQHAARVRAGRPDRGPTEHTDAASAPVNRPPP